MFGNLVIVRDLTKPTNMVRNLNEVRTTNYSLTDKPFVIKSIIEIINGCKIFK